MTDKLSESFICHLRDSNARPQKQFMVYSSRQFGFIFEHTMSTPHNEHVAGDGDSNEDDVQQAIALGEDLIHSIFSLAPLDAIKQKVLEGAPLWYQDNEGTSALHAAAYVSNAPLVRFLIEQGAIWNAVDNLHNSAGDIALSLNDETSYLIIRDAGIRSELILTLLASKPTPTSPLSLVLKATDNTAFADQDTFLASRLRFTKDKYGQDICLLQLDDENSQIDGKGAQVGVMMGWERGISTSRSSLCYEVTVSDETAPS